MNQAAETRRMETQISSALEDITETVRWCKNHLYERRALEAMRLAESNLGYLCLALDWRLEGDLDKVDAALQRIWWGATRTPSNEPTGH